MGFSYGSQAPGTRNNFTGDFQEASIAGIDGRKFYPLMSQCVPMSNMGTVEYAVINASAISTTELAAIAAWEVLQGFYSALPQLDADIKSRDFHLWTESYGEFETSIAKSEEL